MGQLFDKILRPGRNQLIYFGIIVSFFLVFGLYLISFGWFFGFSFYLKISYIILFFLLLVTFLHDKYNKTFLKKYIAITVILLTIYALIIPPSLDYLKISSEKQIMFLGVQVTNYKTQSGKYPLDLNDKFFSNYSKRTFLGTKIFIDSKDTNCYIHYRSLGGVTASFDVKAKRFIYYD